MNPDRQIRPGEIFSPRVCPITKLPLYRKLEWGNVRCGENLELTVGLLGNGIVWSKPSGTGGLTEIFRAVTAVDEIITDTLANEQRYVQIEDYANLKDVSLEGRRFFIRHMRKRQHLVGLIFCNASPLLRISIRLARRLYIGRFRVHVVRDYAKAAKLAVKILDLTNTVIKPPVSSESPSHEDVTKPTRIMRKGVGKLKKHHYPSVSESVNLKHSISTQQNYVEEILKYVGSINWETAGFYPTFDADSSHPYKSVFDALALIKSDLDDVLHERRRAEKQLEESFNKLKKALGGTISAMAITVETRDPYTAGHQQRVANLASAIAKEMEIDSDGVEGIRMAGVMHDVGKLAVPIEILTKPGRLSEMEFGIIKEHPQAGYDILKEITFPWPIANIVLQHHEKIDGSGYPRGLSGDHILVTSRILAVADVVEAMASHRPYRPSLGIEKALQEISKNQGVFYDRLAVDKCLILFREKGFTI